jgi:putative endonuclease
MLQKMWRKHWASKLLVMPAKAGIHDLTFSNLMAETFYVYIITNRPNGILYVGVTNDLSRRIYEHKNKLYKGFSETHGLNILVYYEAYPDPEAAIQAEKRMKKWNRAWKIRRILTANPNWNDLYEDLNK